MPHGSDPRRRSDQQSPDSGSSVPPAWWTSLETGRLPGERSHSHRQRSLRLHLDRLGPRALSLLAPLLVVGAVVAAGFGLAVVGGLLGAGALLCLVLLTVLGSDHERSSGKPSWWR